MTVAGLLLAAGAGRRFGRPKALVELPELVTEVACEGSAFDLDTAADLFAYYSQETA